MSICSRSCHMQFNDKIHTCRNEDSIYQRPRRPREVMKHTWLISRADRTSGVRQTFHVMSILASPQHRGSFRLPLHWVPGSTFLEHPRLFVFVLLPLIRILFHAILQYSIVPVRLLVSMTDHCPYLCEQLTTRGQDPKLKNKRHPIAAHAPITCTKPFSD